MSSQTGVDKTLELLDGLKAVVTDFTAREEKFEREFKIRVAKERQRHDASAQEQLAQLADQISGNEAAYGGQRDAATGKFEKRKAAIGTARKTSKEQSLTRIENKTGARKYELQKRLMQAERNRDSGFAAAAETLQSYKGHVAEEEEHLAALWSQVSSAFGAFPGFAAA